MGFITMLTVLNHSVNENYFYELNFWGGFMCSLIILYG